MGLEFFLVDHYHKHVFELGKGNWPNLIDVRGGVHELSDFCYKALFQFEASDAPERQRNRYYCYWLAEKIRDFTAKTDFDNLTIENDAQDFPIVCIGNPEMGEMGKGKGYKIVGDRFIDDDELAKHFYRFRRDYTPKPIVQLMTLDPKTTHGDYVDCPSRLAQDPKGQWYCVDCGMPILWKKLDAEILNNDT